MTKATKPTLFQPPSEQRVRAAKSAAERGGAAGSLNMSAFQAS